MYRIGMFSKLGRVTIKTLHHYDEVGLQWVEQNGYRITDNVRESYIDGMWNKENADDWLTEIQVPVEKK